MIVKNFKRPQSGSWPGGTTRKLLCIKTLLAAWQSMGNPRPEQCAAPITQDSHQSQTMQSYSSHKESKCRYRRQEKRGKPSVNSYDTISAVSNLDSIAHIRLPLHINSRRTLK